MHPFDPTSDNLLIRGDAADSLERLLPSLRGQIDLIYIDPPYNTGAWIQSRGPLVGYRDDRDHEEWLVMMRSVLLRLRPLLAPHASLFIHLDDNELDYMKVEADRVFGRRNFINRITLAARSPSSFSTVNRGVFKSSEYLLWYAADRAQLRCNPLRAPREPDPAYRLFLENPEDPCEDWRLIKLSAACPRRAERDRFRVENARQVCRLAAVSDIKAGRATAELKRLSLAEPERVLKLERPGMEPRYLLRGQQLIFYEKQVALIQGRLTASQPLTDIWSDISWEGIAREGGVTFRRGKKPERLLQRILELTTLPGDRVLDCFLGSGTTAAVAHKMGRRWIGIESQDHLALARERLARVIRGEDPSGVTAESGWTGGGNFLELQWDDKGEAPGPPTA